MKATLNMFYYVCAFSEMKLLTARNCLLIQNFCIFVPLWRKGFFLRKIDKNHAKKTQEVLWTFA